MDDDGLDNLEDFYHSDEEVAHVHANTNHDDANSNAPEAVLRPVQPSVDSAIHMETSFEQPRRLEATMSNTSNGSSSVSTASTIPLLAAADVTIIKETNVDVIVIDDDDDTTDVKAVAGHSNQHQEKPYLLDDVSVEQGASDRHGLGGTLPFCFEQSLMNLILYAKNIGLKVKATLIKPTSFSELEKSPDVHDKNSKVEDVSKHLSRRSQISADIPEELSPSGVRNKMMKPKLDERHNNPFYSPTNVNARVSTPPREPSVPHMPPSPVYDDEASTSEKQQLYTRDANYVEPQDPVHTTPEVLAEEVLPNLQEPTPAFYNRHDSHELQARSDALQSPALISKSPHFPNEEKISTPVEVSPSMRESSIRRDNSRSLPSMLKVGHKSVITPLPRLPARAHKSTGKSTARRASSTKNSSSKASSSKGSTRRPSISSKFSSPGKRRRQDAGETEEDSDSDFTPLVNFDRESGSNRRSSKRRVVEESEEESTENSSSDLEIHAAEEEEDMQDLSYVDHQEPVAMEEELVEEDYSSSEASSSEESESSEESNEAVRGPVRTSSKGKEKAEPVSSVLEISHLIALRYQPSDSL